MTSDNPLSDRIQSIIGEIRSDLVSANDTLARLFGEDFDKLGFEPARDIDLARQHIYRAWALLANTTGLVSGERKISHKLPFIPSEEQRNARIARNH